jgi:hypothetical protein
MLLPSLDLIEPDTPRSWVSDDDTMGSFNHDVENLAWLSYVATGRSRCLARGYFRLFVVYSLGSVWVGI